MLNYPQGRGLVENSLREPLGKCKLVIVGLTGIMSVEDLILNDDALRATSLIPGILSLRQMGCR